MKDVLDDDREDDPPCPVWFCMMPLIAEWALASAGICSGNALRADVAGAGVFPRSGLSSAGGGLLSVMVLSVDNAGE